MRDAARRVRGSWQARAVGSSPPRCLSPGLGALAPALATVLAGCLSTPGPADPDGGGGGDGGDAAPRRCRPAGTLPTPTPWPPAGVVVRQVQVADVDGDGVDDLVITVAPEAARAAGAARVYVLYGPVAPGAPAYHAVLDVGVEAAVIPWATTLHDVDGDGCLDLTVAGPPVEGASRSFVALWRHGGTATPWQGAPVRADLSREPFAGPVMAVWADLSTDSDLDLAVADLHDVDVFVGATLDAVPAALRAPRPGPGACDAWGNLNAVVRQPTAGGRDRLLAFGHYRHNSLVIDDGGTLLTSQDCTEVTARPITRGVAALDLDGEAPLDLLSGGGGLVGAHLLAGPADPVSPLTGATACAATPRGGDFIEGIAAGDLGGFATPEVVLIDLDDPSGMSYACLLDAVDVDATRAIATATSETPLGPGVARAVVIGDVGGGPRVWIAMADGALRCLARGAAAVLEPC